MCFRLITGYRYSWADRYMWARDDSIILGEKYISPVFQAGLTHYGLSVIMCSRFLRL